MNIKLKVGRNILDIDENDLILDNSACQMIITKKIFKEWSNYSPTMSKKLFKDLKGLNFIYTNEELKDKCQKMYGCTDTMTLYKFDVETMSKHGY